MSKRRGKKEVRAADSAGVYDMAEEDIVANEYARVPGLDPEAPTAREALAAGGVLALHIPGFAAREAQQRMAQAVEQTLATRGTLVCEAGTGTGKTYAYLVPALLSGLRTLISTGTKTLQDQLFHRDLPLVRQALNRPVAVALLKGRANYVCLHRMEQHSHTPDMIGGARVLRQLQKVRDWAGRTQSGDIAELSSLAEDAEVWPYVTSTADNCLGQTCSSLEHCFLFRARRKANEADIVVVNHHLFFADMALREDGFGELLPGVEAVVLDEAHQLAETAMQFFGTRFTSRQCQELVTDCIQAQREEAGDSPAIEDAANQVSDATREMRLALGPDSRRAALALLQNTPAFAQAQTAMEQALTELVDALALARERGRALDNCHQRAQDLRARLLAICQPPAEGAGQVAWLETFSKAFLLNLTPLSVAEPFQSFCQRQKCAWIFTSATLSVGDDFSHFCRGLGLVETEPNAEPNAKSNVEAGFMPALVGAGFIPALNVDSNGEANAAQRRCSRPSPPLTLRLESPFDFRNNALFYLPENLPEPSAPDFTEHAVQAALPVLKLSQGRAFLLFTSHRALQIAANLLAAEDLPYPLLVQGNAARGELLRQFRAQGNAVLLGAGSFWEGVDVRGEALSCVIIDKLPFASPGDPVMEARIAHMRSHGGEPFAQLQLPQAVIALKQGAGRLIRDVSDCGLLMVCDRRLVDKPYGRAFLTSLPPMPKTRKLEVVQRFFARFTV